MELEWLGPYRIVGKLGRGGMGTVYEGVHRETGETAAVKLLSASLAQEEGFRVRFEAEIETLRKLNHPNIVRLFGFGEQDGQLFYSMELVDGNSLEEELQRGRRFDWREAARIGIAMCLALRHAHDRGIIHRDIKPGNLLLANDGRLKLSDFGIAKLFGNSRLTGAGNVVGTAEYMAPEQAEGRPVDARSDLYSLGAVMYALLARRPVFRGKSLVEVLHKQRFELAEPVRNYAPDTPDELERILAQLLEKDPERRMPNANVLGRRLEAMVHALSVVGETTEADADWFLTDELAPASEPAQPTNAAAVAQTIDRPVDDLPFTQALGNLTEDGRKALEGTCQDLRLQNPSPAAIASTPSIADTNHRNGHFVTVSEDELDPVDEDEPRPAISWQTLALAVSLLLVGLSVRWFLQPPTADSLYASITALAVGESPLARSEVEPINREIDDFLNCYSDDPRAGEIREYEKKIDLRRLEWEFDQQTRGKATTNGLLPIQQVYLEAISHSRLDPTLAVRKLQSLVELYSQPEDETGSVGQCLTLARRRLAQLRKEVGKLADEQLPHLKERLDTADALRQSEPDRAIEMYRAVIELYGDKPWAADVVNRAREALAKKP